MILGASLESELCYFRVWAPRAERVVVRLTAGGRDHEFETHRHGAICGVLAPARAGDRYSYLVDDHSPVPDPISRSLPEGVHGPTEIVDPASFLWTDAAWRGLPLKNYVIYELHVGTFTAAGTFEAAIEELPYLQRLGITVIELMPLAAFPGARNWGYDGVSLYAVQASYGGPEGLRRFVDAAHAHGLAVILDVVYNHLGNEGNYLRLFGPYFTVRHHTPWGEAINYDQEDSERVRDYVTGNALYWIREYHIDGLRLDAVQTIRDDSPTHILAEIAEKVSTLAQELGREVVVIAETDANDETMVLPRAGGGYGLDAEWSDDFHHAVHAFFTGERSGFYSDFGRPEQIVRALNEGFVFQGEPFQFWDGRLRGRPAPHMPAAAHVICLQNHDVVGNRPGGERLTVLIPLGARLVAAALLLLAPHTPLIFMGQEYDETNPFLFFTDYGDPALAAAVREGREREFVASSLPDTAIADPQNPATFARSKLNWQLAESENESLGWYRSLLELRRKYVVDGKRSCRASLEDGVIHLQVPAGSPRIKVLARILGAGALPEPGDGWEQALAGEADGFVVSVFRKP